MCFPGSYKNHKSVLNPLEPELEMAVIHHVGIGNQTRVLRMRSVIYPASKEPMLESLRTITTH